MILFSNLKNVSVSGKEYKIIPTLKLTSSRIKDEITISNLNTNKFLSEKDKDILKKLFKEAHENNFEVLIKKGL